MALRRMLARAGHGGPGHAALRHGHSRSPSGARTMQKESCPAFLQRISGDQVARALEQLQRSVIIAGHGQHARSADMVRSLGGQSGVVTRAGTANRGCLGCGSHVDGFGHVGGGDSGYLVDSPHVGG
jgi:hypothetical protein